VSGARDNYSAMPESIDPVPWTGKNAPRHGLNGLRSWGHEPRGVPRKPASVTSCLGLGFA